MLGWQVLQLRTTVERERGDIWGVGGRTGRIRKGEIGGREGHRWREGEEEEGVRGEHEKQFRWRRDGDREEIAPMVS